MDFKLDLGCCLYYKKLTLRYLEYRLISTANNIRWWYSDKHLSSSISIRCVVTPIIVIIMQKTFKNTYFYEGFNP